MGQPRPVNVTVTRTIPVDRMALASFVADLNNSPLWCHTVNAVNHIGLVSSAVGSKFVVDSEFLGRHISYAYEIMEHIPGQRLLMASSDGPFPIETVYAWQEVRGGTRIRLTNRGYPSGFSVYLNPIYSFAMRREMTKDLRQLDQLVRERGL